MVGLFLGGGKYILFVKCSKIQFLPLFILKPQLGELIPAIGERGGHKVKWMYVLQKKVLPYPDSHLRSARASRGCQYLETISSFTSFYNNPANIFVGQAHVHVFRLLRHTAW